MAKDLKTSTKKLCRQLEKKPDVQGNQRQVRKHKTDLVKKIEEVIWEMEHDLTFNNFNRNINEQIEDQQKYDKQKQEERQLTQDIQVTSAKYKKMQNDFAKEQEENNKEMAELKRQKNETQVEKDLHIQYLKRQIQGKQSCEDRLHDKMESEIQKKIDEINHILNTEREVNDAVQGHLKERTQLLLSKYKEQEAKREGEVARIETEKNELKNRKTKAQNEVQEIYGKIAEDTEERRRRDEENRADND